MSRRLETMQKLFTNASQGDVTSILILVAMVAAIAAFVYFRVIKKPAA